MQNLNLQEVEIRAKLSIEEQTQVIGKIKELGGVPTGEESILDNYWCISSFNNFEDVRMDKVGTYSLRTRKRNKGGILTTDLNTKVITKENDHNAWDEFETSVSDFENTENILKSLGFKVFFSLEKTRETYLLNEYTIVLENITNYGLVMEVELMLSKDIAESGKGKILEFMKENFGINDTNIIPKTPVNEMMQAMAKFT